MWQARFARERQLREAVKVNLCYIIAAVVWVQSKYLEGCLCGRLVLRGNNS